MNQARIQNLESGYVYNAWKTVYLKWVDEKLPGVLTIFTDSSMKEIYDKIPQNELKSILPHKENSLVFVATTTQASIKTNKREFYFKAF